MVTTKKTTKKEEIVKEVPAKKKKEVVAVISFTGKYLKTIGRRKTAIAEVRLYPTGEGKIAVNGKEAEVYFHPDRAAVAFNPLKLTDLTKALYAPI